MGIGEFEIRHYHAAPFSSLLSSSSTVIPPHQCYHWLMW